MSGWFIQIIACSNSFPIDFFCPYASLKFHADRTAMPIPSIFSHCLEFSSEKYRPLCLITDILFPFLSS